MEVNYVEPIRKNMDLDLIDNCVDELYELTKEKNTGFGIIRVENYGPISEYYSTLNDIQKFDNSKNLCIIQAKDNIDRKAIRQMCLIKYSVIRNETKT